MASTASCANVSALDNSVGSPATPRSLALTLRPGGSAALPLTAFTSAPPSPETKRSGTTSTRTRRAKAGVLPHGGLHGVGGQPVAPHRDHDPPGAQFARREHGPFQYQVGRPEQQGFVLGTARLALGRVDQHDRVAPAVLSRSLHRPELAGHGEGRAAAPAQADLLGHLDEPAGGQRGSRAEGRTVGRQVEPLQPVKSLGQPGLADAQDLGQAWRQHGSSPRAGRTRATGAAASSAGRAAAGARRRGQATIPGQAPAGPWCPGRAPSRRTASPGPARQRPGRPRSSSPRTGCACRPPSRPCRTANGQAR